MGNRIFRPYGTDPAASRTCSGRAILKRFSVIMRKRIVPDESSRTRPAAQSLGRWLSGLNVGRPGPAPLQAPQSTRREDGGKEPGHANRDQGPHKEKASA